MRLARWAGALLAGMVALAGCAGSTGGGGDAGTPSSSAPASSASAPLPPSPFALRGVVEGFYGPAWTPAATRDILSFMGAEGMNTFVYAPKNDPYQRADWSKAYPAQPLSDLRALVQAGAGDGVGFVYSVSPGLSITYSSPADRAALEAKIAQLRSIGVHAFMLSLDDIPSKLQHSADVHAYGNNLAAAQVDLANALWTAEARLDPAFRLMVTPTEYYGTTADTYLQTLARLDPAIDVVWTGPGVLSPRLTLHDAQAFGAIVGRKPVVWYNYPVNDWTVPTSQLTGNLPSVQPRDLFMGPVEGLDPNLAQGVKGILANPMLEPYASKIPLASLAAYLANPSAPDVTAAWQRQIQSSGGAAAPALAVFSASEQPYPAVTAKGTYVWTTTDAATDALEAQLLQTYAQNPAAARGSAPETALRRTFSAWNASAGELAPGKLADPGLAAEIAPWVTLMPVAGQAGLDALALLDADTAARPAARAVVRKDLDRLSAEPVEFGGDLVHFLQMASAAAG